MQAPGQVPLASVEIVTKDALYNNDEESGSNKDSSRVAGETIPTRAQPSI